MSDDDGPTPDEEWAVPDQPTEEPSMNILDMMSKTTNSFIGPRPSPEAKCMTPLMLPGKKRKKKQKDPGFLVSTKRVKVSVPMHDWIQQSDERQILVFLYRLGNGRPSVWRIKRRHELRREQLAYLITHNGTKSYRHLDGCDGSGHHFCCAWRGMCEDLTHVDRRTMMESVTLPEEGHETRFITLNS